MRTSRRRSWIVLLASLACVAGFASAEATSTAGDRHSSVTVVTVRATSITRAFTTPRPGPRLPLALAALVTIARRVVHTK